MAEFDPKLQQYYHCEH